MKSNFFSDNLFYYLNVLPTDRRSEIISKVEEKSFLEDSNFEDAQNIIINPSKRLIHELRWFCDITPDKIKIICQCIEQGEKIDISELNGISKLNAILYNFSISKFLDCFEIGYLILDIDDMYENINIDLVLESINMCRKKAGMIAVQKTEIDNQLNIMRDYIKQTISDKLNELEVDEYIKLITMLADNCVANSDYDDGIIISDVINQYEIRMQPDIENLYEELLNNIEDFFPVENNTKIEQKLDELIEKLNAWDKLVNPLKVKLSIEGREDKKSRNIAEKCRDIAIDLYNNHNNIDASYKLLKVLKDLFKELDEFIEKLNVDETQIVKIKKDEERFKQEKIANCQADKEYLVDVIGGKFVVPPLCTCCLTWTSNMESVSHSNTTPTLFGNKVRTISVELPICNECLKHRSKYNHLHILICLLAILSGSACLGIFMLIGIEAFLSILLSCGLTAGAYYLYSYLWEMPALSKEHSARMESSHIISALADSADLTQNNKITEKITFIFSNWEYAQLFFEANKTIAMPIKEKNKTNTARANNAFAANENFFVKMLYLVGVFFLISIFLAGSISVVLEDNNYQKNGSSNMSSQNSNNKNNAKQKKSNNTENNNVLKANIENMEAKLIDMENDINSDESKLKKLSDDLEYYENQYNITGNDFYYNNYNETVEEYNNLYDSYSKAIEEYNDLYAEYSAAIDDYNSKIY